MLLRFARRGIVDAMRSRSEHLMGGADGSWRGGLPWPCLLPLVSVCALTACGGGARRATVVSYHEPIYTAPGPPSDPWGPYIVEASGRFHVPQNWIRAVMHQESGGHEYRHGQLMTSDAGATGLMQVMPATYAELAGRYGLGSDPYEPHDNIIAGTGYIKDLYDRYGSPNFLAAYNAGPHRLDAYLAGQGELPNETVNYVASIAPSLTRDSPLTGPLSVYADSGRFPAAQDPVPRAYARAQAAGCWQDPDAAYDPDAPCRSAPPVRMAAAVPAVPMRQPPPGCWHDPDAAYDPNAPCGSRPSVRMASALPVASGQAVRGWGQGAPAGVAEPVTRPVAAAQSGCWHDPDAAYDPAAPCAARPPAAAAIRGTSPPPPVRMAAVSPGPDWQRLLAVPTPRPQPNVLRSSASFLIPSAAASTPRQAAMAMGRWGIQIGAYANPGQARRMAESVRSLAPRELGGAQVALGPTSPFGGQVLYRARLEGMSARSATEACSLLSAQSQSCVTVPPRR